MSANGVTGYYSISKPRVKGDDFCPSGGASEECGGGVAHLLLCTVVCTLDGCSTGSAAGRQEAGKTGTGHWSLVTDAVVLTSG